MILQFLLSILLCIWFDILLFANLLFVVGEEETYLFDRGDDDDVIVVDVIIGSDDDIGMRGSSVKQSSTSSSFCNFFSPKSQYVGMTPLPCV